MVSLEVGGKTNSPSIGQTGQSIKLEARVANITDGRFTITGPMQTGLEVNLGKTVVLETSELQLVLSELRWEPYDPGCFTHAGLDPLEKRFILIKSRQHFRASFESIARHIVLAAGPGVCSSDYSQFPFKFITRPMYPIDENASLEHKDCFVAYSDAT